MNPRTITYNQIIGYNYNICRPGLPHRNQRILRIFNVKLRIEHTIISPRKCLFLILLRGVCEARCLRRWNSRHD